MVKYFKKTGQLIWQYNEVFVWLAFLILLYTMNEGPQFSFCIFKLMGFEKCPGCGIGHSIHYLLHLEISRSVQEHIMGVPAAIFIVFRIIRILFTNQNQTLSHGANVYDVTRFTT